MKVVSFVWTIAPSAATLMLSWYEERPRPSAMTARRWAESVRASVLTAAART